jgi:hypothetical protein
MAARVEAQIERFAPGFRDLALARATRTAAREEALNPNYVGGDIAAGILADSAAPGPALESLSHSDPRRLPVLVVHPAAARRARPLTPRRSRRSRSFGDPEGALADWRRALELNPRNHGPAYASAYLLEREGRLAEAAES